MDSIKTVLMNYAVCALLGSIFEFIAPRRNKETFRIISSLILISVIIIPLATFDFKGAFEEQEFQFETEQTEEKALQNTTKLIERESLLKMFNMSDRLIDTLEDLEKVKVQDYDNAFKNVEKEVEKSRMFLKKALNVEE